MEKYNSKLWCIILTLSICGLGACTDYLDKAPLSDIDPDDVYKNFTNFQGFTEQLYHCIPLPTASEYHNNWNFGEDEYWEPAEQRLAANQFDQGNYWAWNTAYYSWFKTGGDPNDTEKYNKAKQGKASLWGNSWYAIRKANVGIANLDKLTDATEEEKNLIAGQLYFFRGWFHFMLMQYWGGLPYLDEVLPSNTTIKLPRLTYQQTADKAAEDLRMAASLLPVDWDDTTVGKATLGNNNIRVNKIMALSWLGKNLLVAGSPLMNQISGGSAAYNTEYCKQAADVFAEALQICESTRRYELADFSQYTQLFYTYNQSFRLPGLKEAIFYENLAEADNVGGGGGRFRWNQINDYRPPSLINTGIKVYPTANYVNYYGMKNGLPIPDLSKKDPESGYDPEYPWKDRDPRFYHDFMIDGERCVQDGSRVGNDPERQYASLYSDGRFRDDPGNRAKSVFTGYMLSKFTSKYLNQWEGYDTNNNMVLSLMRLADVYLMYAEATLYGYGTPQSKAGSYSLTAVDAVNKIRERAGIDPVHSKYLGDTESFMAEIRRERAVELSFEGHRFLDLRRWMLLLDKPYTLKTAIQFDRGTPEDELFADPVNARVLNLREEVLRERTFSEKHYWFPFLKDDVDMYVEFTQNPGW